MKTIKAKDILFYYNPNIGELTIFTGLKFTNIDGQKFKVDINPNGQSKLKEIGFSLIYVW